GLPILTVSVLCRRLDWQLSCMAEIFAGLSPIFRDVKRFHFNTIQGNSEQDYVDHDPSLLLELFHPFTNVEEITLPHYIASHVGYKLEREENARVTGVAQTSFIRVGSTSGSYSVSFRRSSQATPSKSSIPSLPDLALRSPTQSPSPGPHWQL
ncbi:hypothetical protein BGW80DRAFT_1338090, partial [Lactifluus volemus]